MTDGVGLQNSSSILALELFINRTSAKKDSACFIVNLMHGIAYYKLGRDMWESVEDYKRASAIQPVQAFKHTCLQVCWEGVLRPRTVSVEHHEFAA